MASSDSESSQPRPTVNRAPVAGLPSVHQIVLPTPWDVGPVQVYLCEGDPLTLVDTGVRDAASWASLGAALGELGYAPRDIQRVILTHWHEDHLGQAERLREAGAELEVFVHRDDAEICEAFSPERNVDPDGHVALFGEAGVPGDVLAQLEKRWRAFLSEDPLCAATRIERRLVHGERVRAGDAEFEVIHAPGHTAGHLLLHEPSSGALITGDHLMGNAVPFTTRFYTAAAPDPGDPHGRRPCFRGLPAYLESVRALRARSFRMILPAHGGLLDRPARTIEDAILFYEVRVQRAERALEKLLQTARDASPWEIWRALFPKHDPVEQLHHRLVMVQGALDVLEDAGRVALRREGATLRYWFR